MSGALLHKLALVGSIAVLPLGLGGAAFVALSHSPAAHPSRVALTRSHGQNAEEPERSPGIPFPSPGEPGVSPLPDPSILPSALPTDLPSGVVPSALPSVLPSDLPSVLPSALPSPTAAGGPRFTNYPLPHQNSGPYAIALGPDGNAWFTETINGASGRIGRISPTGELTEFDIPSASPQSLGIAAGADGNLWFTELGANKVGRVTTSGSFTEWAVPIQYGYPRGIARGADGNMWFTLSTGQCHESIGRVTSAGTITIFPVTTACNEIDEIAAGPDGAMWFTEPPYVGRIAMDGSVTRFPVAGSPYGITSGPDGNLWVTEYLGNKIARMTTGGVVTEYGITSTTACSGPAPPPDGCTSSGPQNIVVGPDRNLWFAEEHTDRVGRITTAGAMTEFDVPTANAQPQAMCLGSDGNLWLTEPTGTSNGQVARLQL